MPKDANRFLKCPPNMVLTKLLDFPCSNYFNEIYIYLIT